MALLLERTYGTASQSGAREDLSNLIANVDAKSTVFSSMAKKGKKPGNVLISVDGEAKLTPLAVASSAISISAREISTRTTTTSNSSRVRRRLPSASCGSAASPITASLWVAILTALL